MSVVVTGASGFIGRHVTALLQVRGHRVVSIDRRPGADADLEIIADLATPDDAVRTALGEAEAVIHLAGCPGVRDRADDVELRRQRDNVEATATVCRLTPGPTPLAVASSSSVYGGSRGTASHEDDTPRPLGGYARSKVRAEAESTARAGRGGHVVVLRPFTVAGEGQRPDMALSRWLAAAEAGEPLTLLGSRDRTRDVTDVRQVAEGFVRAIERSPSTIINLGTGSPKRLGELLEAVATVTGRPLDVRAIPAAREEVPATLADTRRCTELLGFTPTTDLLDLVSRQHAAADSPRTSLPYLEVV